MTISPKHALRFRLLAFTLSATLLSPMLALTQDRPEPETGRIQREAVHSKTYMAVSANPLASLVGRDILRRGGSAVDAAIAIQLVLGLVEPQYSGIGGGAFLVYYDRQTKEIHT